MEEKKAKEVKLNPSSTSEPQERKLSYDDLNKICAELYQQNQKLSQQIHQMNMTNAFKRLDYLFKVIECSATIKDPEFISTCVEEIKTAISVDDSDNQEDK